MSLGFVRDLKTVWPEAPEAYAGLRVSGITDDSRHVRPGDIFVAQKGFSRDAREYIAEVIGKGAAVVLAEQDEKWPEHRMVQKVPVLVVPDLAAQVGWLAARFYGEPSKRMKVLAVTGTNGKTSVANLLAGALTALGNKCAVIGTIGNGIYGQLQSATHTTPEAIRLQQFFAEFEAAGVEYVAMEASSHGLELGRMTGTHIHTALFTNLTRDHLDFHGDMATYAAAKARLFAWPGLRAAVLNADDEQYSHLRQVLSPTVSCCSYSLKADSTADFVAESVQPSLKGLAIAVRSREGAGDLNSPLLGRFNVSNLLAVLGGLLSLGISFEEAVVALGGVRPVPGRMECFTGLGPTAVVDYAHTPDALEKALSSLREHTEGRLWCVFGCGGDRDKGKRPQMAAVAERLADEVLVTTDNPRSEKPEAIIADIQAGFSAPRSVELDRRGAIRHAIAAAAENDIVLIAGKGHEDYQEIHGVRYPFSDVNEVKAALAARRSA